jgi:hypothetical protein
MKTTQHNNKAGPKEMDQPGGERGLFFVARERERKRG